MMDPAKLKVVELRAELAKRGLDQRGIKAVLVARLQEALEAEEKEEDEEQEDEVLSDHGEEMPETNDSIEQTKTDTIVHDETSAQSVQSSEQDVPHQEEDSSQFVSYQEESESKLISEVNEDSVAQSVEENSEVSSEVPAVDDESSIQIVDHRKSRPVEETSGENSRFSEMGAATQPHSDSHGKSEPDVSKQDEEVRQNYKGYEEFSDYLVQEDSSSKNNFEDQSMDTWQQTGEESERSFQLQHSSLHLDDSNAQDALETRQKSSDMEDVKPDVKDVKEEKQDESAILMQSEEIKPETEVRDDAVSAREIKEEGDSAEPYTIEPSADQEMKEESVEPNREDDKRPKTEKRDDNERERKNRWDDNRQNDAKKRQRSPSEKRRSPPRKPDDEPDYDENAVLLSWYDSDLHLLINKDNFFSATMITHSGFGYVWAGVRATFGFEKGKVYYETKITENLKVPYLEDEANPNVLRVGWSVQGSPLQLGEDPLSYGFGATGKKSTKCQFQNYGKSFLINDVVGCFLDIDANRAEISYTINGEYQGVAFTIDHEELKGQPLFPHILTKNCTFEVNFGAQDPWFEPLPGYTNVGKVPLEDRISGPKRLMKREDCEIIMMVGLPGCGKTTWATKYAQEHKDKMYNILGTNALIEKMKVMGLPRIRNYAGRWESLIAKCTKCLNTLLEIGAYRRRNYILDQVALGLYNEKVGNFFAGSYYLKEKYHHKNRSVLFFKRHNLKKGLDQLIKKTNVYPSAQRRKMRGFEGFVRRAVVIVPTDEELKSRTSKREAEEGKDVPDTAVLEMKANFAMPEKGDVFNEVIFPELQEEEAKAMISRYNREGNDAGYQSNFQQQKRFRMDDNRDRRDNFRGDNRQDGQDRGRMDNRGRMDRGGHDGWRDRGFNNNRRRPDNRGGMGGPPRPGNWRDNRGGWRGGPPNRFNDRGGPGPRYMRDRNRDYRDRRDTSGGNKMQDRRNNDRDDKNRPKPVNQGSSQNWGGQSQGNYNQAWGQGYANQAWGNWNQGYNQQQWKGYGQQTQQQGWGQQGWGNQGWANAGWNQQYYNQYQQNWAQQQPQQSSQQQQQQLQHTQQQQHHQGSGATDSSHGGGTDNTAMAAAYAGYSSTATPQAGTWAGYTTVGSTGYASMGAAAPVGSTAGMSGGGGGGGNAGGLSASSYASTQKQYRQDPRKAS